MNPLIIEDLISVAANTVNDNVIASNNSLRSMLNATFNGKGKFVGVISATGLRVDVGYGSQNVISSADLRVDTVMQEPNDVINDDFYVPMGSQLFIRAANTTGGAIVLRYRYQLDDLADLAAMGFGDGNLQPDMLVMQRGPVAVANGTTDQQLLDGLQYEQPPTDVTMDVLMTGSSSVATFTKQLMIETQRLAPPTPFNANNRVPTKPFDEVLSDIQVRAQQRVSIPVTNNSGGSLNCFWRTEMKQMVRL